MRRDSEDRPRYVSLAMDCGMSMDDDALVAFAAPPIEEVVLGVQFPAIPNFSDAHAGLYWQRVRSQYPRAENQPRLEGAIESPGPPQPVRLELPLGTVAQSRTWLIGESDESLIQIQNTRFNLNWRQRGKSPYPHFNALREEFAEYFKVFFALLRDEGLHEPAVQQVEVTYINWITDLPVEVFFVPAGATRITLPSGEHTPEDQNLGFRYLLEETDTSIKRLYIQCQPGFKQQAPTERGYQFSLVYRAARPSGFAGNEVLSLLEEGRVMAGAAFAGLTTAEAHRAWKRYR